MTTPFRVFGFGSLMTPGWERRFHCVGIEKATLQGYRRSFRKASIKNWGTKENPAPTLDLEKQDGSKCEGLLFSFDERSEQDIRAYLLEREGKSFPLVPVRVSSKSADLEAVVPIYSGKNIIRAELRDLAAMAAKAKGTEGDGLAYIEGVARAIRSLGIYDVGVAQLEWECARLRPEMAMMIDEHFPRNIGAKAILTDQISHFMRDGGASEREVAELLGMLPPRLSYARCYLDALTNFWRYEFGEPIYLEKEEKNLVGVHMWPPVQDLISAMRIVAHRLNAQKRAEYLRRLDNPGKHYETLTEMVPLFRVSEEVYADFEVVGKGPNQTSIDWALSPLGEREILFDVKSRIADLIAQMDRPGSGGEMAAPAHDVGLLFRGLEKKFSPADPKKRLQGAWIGTFIKQEQDEIKAAFGGLDPARIHFAILGDWEGDALILVRDEADREFLEKIFGIKPTGRFTFRRK